VLMVREGSNWGLHITVRSLHLRAATRVSLPRATWRPREFLSTWIACWEDVCLVQMACFYLLVIWRLRRKYVGLVHNWLPNIDFLLKTLFIDWSLLKINLSRNKIGNVSVMWVSGAFANLSCHLKATKFPLCCWATCVAVNSMDIESFAMEKQKLRVI
jgi:hypothetical protein